MCVQGPWHESCDMSHFWTTSGTKWNCSLCVSDLGARFTKQGKLALEHNSIIAPMEYYAGDLLTMNTLKNTNTARSFTY